MTSFLDDLQRQLVAASRSLSRAQPLATDGPLRRRSALRRSSLMLIGALVAGGTAFAATTQLIGDRNESLRVLDRLATIPESSDHRWVRANGPDPAKAKLAFVTPAGLEVYTVADAQATCIMVSDGDEQCYRAINIPAGHGFSIGNECSVGSDRHMRIDGAAPRGSRRVHIQYSSGPGHTADVIRGVFVIDTTTPTQGDPYPVAFEALDADGATIVRTAIHGRNLCMDGS